MMTKKFKFRISRLNLSLTPEGQFYGKKKRCSRNIYNFNYEYMDRFYSAVKILYQVFSMYVPWRMMGKQNSVSERAWYLVTIRQGTYVAQK